MLFKSKRTTVSLGLNERIFNFKLTAIILFIIFSTIKTNEISSFDPKESNDLYANILPLNFYSRRVLPFVSNLSTIIGETVSFNCSVYDNNKDENAINSSPRLNPTWLKADVVYNQYGYITAYKTENIIITRKGIIVDGLRDKMKLITSNDQFQTLKLVDVNAKSEGKYICREFSSQSDKLFYLNVYAGVTGLGMKFASNSKYFRIVQPGSSVVDEDNPMKSLKNSLTSSISIKENDELIINCTVNSSKPAANLSVWIVPNHRTTNDEDTRKLNLYESYTSRNKDFTLKTIGIARVIVNRFDNLKSVTCIAENTALDEKWEAKKILNVLYSPKCSKYQKLIYNVGINQTVELECRMSDANPPYLDFDWILTSDKMNTDRDHSRSNGFTSRIKFTPKSLNDFGEVTCIASNGLENGECRMQLQLGGPPNPPYDCFHKENNKTVIIECKPGFDQGDAEMYFYLLKKKTSGLLVEYARKRDSCSFLISNLILEEHLNDFFIYSSNKYGNNKEQATKLTIENKEFLLKTLDQQQETSSENSKRLAMIAGALFMFLAILMFFICLAVKCHNDSISNKKLSYTSDSSSPSYNDNYKHQLPYKYSSHLNNYNQKQRLECLKPESSKYIQSRKLEEKNDYSVTSNESMTISEFENEKALVITNPVYENTPKSISNTTLKKKLIEKLNAKNMRSPSILNNIQDLDMSPKSKRIGSDFRNKGDSNPSSRSLTDETTETDSENYIDFSQQKLKLNNFEDKTSLSDDQNRELEKEFYTPINTKSYVNSLKKSKGNLTANNYTNKINLKPMNNVNSWYNDSNDEFSGVSVDKSVINEATNSIIRISDYSNFNKPMNGKLSINSNDFDEDLEEKKLFQWPKNNLPLFSGNETSSLDVDDEKIVGILV